MTLPRPRVKIREGYSMFTCEVRGCTLQVSTPGGSSTTHKCPYEGGSIRYSWSVYGMHMLDKLWREADSQYELLKAGSDNPEQIGFLKGRLRGLCFALLNFYGGANALKSEDDIARMIVSRNKIGVYRDGGDPTIPGNRFFEEPPTARVFKPPAHLTPDDVQAIKSSTFPIELLASTYDTTPPIIKAIQSQP